MIIKDACIDIISDIDVICSDYVIYVCLTTNACIDIITLLINE